MKTFKVWAKYTTYCDIDIEAETQQEAEEIAEKTDGGNFSADDCYDSDWHIVTSMTTEQE